MKFSEFTYSRPSLSEYSRHFEDLLKAFTDATTFEEHNRIFKTINDFRLEYNSMYNICHIRHTIDTTDQFYEAENSFYDDSNPAFDALVNRFYEALLQSPFRKELEAAWGNQLFVIAELSLKTFQPSILEDLREENKLGSEYVKLKASAKIKFEGKEYNLSSLLPLETSEDRATRKAASEAKWAYYEEQAPKVEQIFDQQVKVRHRIAQKLGYKNFVELGYARMLRSDYNAEAVAGFRQQIAEHIVPISTELFERQRQRLGLDQLKFYDENFRFASGNPKPQGPPEWIVDRAGKMYRELSPETKEFFEYMLDNDLMDLVNREGKATGGYCTFIDKYKSPYIFSNFNGTSGDIDVLTHEAGHAFQVYSSRNIGLKEYYWPTYEACEIHSMSMEFFTWPWMHLFFGADTEKYKFSHLSGAILFLPYGVAIDEFQHFAYSHPEASPAERNEAWRAIEKKYLPHRNYDGLQFLENGAFWQRQSHVFTVPFYYIDYTLAQICAFQFWQRDRKNHRDAWSNYIRLCKAGGSGSFLELVDLAGLTSPFEEGCVKSVVGEIKKWLDGIDDSRF
ncbi:MAG: M3 family oligoendopeptidase [Bacteroidota bacterium]